MVKIEVNLAKKLDDIYSEISDVKSNMVGLHAEFRAMNGKVTLNIKKNSEQDATISKNTTFRIASNAIKKESNRKTVLIATVIATVAASIINIIASIL